MKNFKLLICALTLLLAFSFTANAATVVEGTSKLSEQVTDGIIRIVVELNSSNYIQKDVGVILHQSESFASGNGWDDGIALIKIEQNSGAPYFQGYNAGWADPQVSLPFTKKMALWFTVSPGGAYNISYQLEGETTVTNAGTYASRAHTKTGVGTDFIEYCSTTYNDKDGKNKAGAIITVDPATVVDAIEAYAFPMPIYGDTTDVATCDNMTYSFDGMELSTAGLYSKTIKAVDGNDSIVTINLSINPSYNMSDTTEYMISDPSFEAVGMQTVTVSNETLKSCKECDSIVAEYMTLKYEANTYSDTTYISVNDTTYTNIDLYDTTYITVEDTLVFNLVAGLSGTPENVMVKLYPNPSTDMLYVSFSDISSLSNINLELYNMTGAKVAEKAVTEATSSLNISSFAAGTYLLNIVKDGAILDNKVVIIQ